MNTIKIKILFVLLSAAMALMDSVQAEIISHPFGFTVLSTGDQGTTPFENWRSSDTASAGWQLLSYAAVGWSKPRFSYPAPTSPDPALSAGIAESGCSYNCFMWYDPAITSDGTTGALNAYFRRPFALANFSGSALPFVATAYVIADDDFELWINGTKVLTDADYGTPNDLGPDIVHTADVTSLIVPGQMNIIALHATDGNLNGAADIGHEHVLFRLWIHTVPEPSSLALTCVAGFVGLWAVSGRRRAQRGR